MHKLLNKQIIIVILLTIVGTLLHFYNLNWGAPFYFHPDERNVASAISQLRFPEQMNPNFFAYGSLPIYVVYFTGMLFNTITNSSPFNVPFDQAIIIGRLYSALFATALIPLIYCIGRRLHDPTTGIVAATFATFSTGFIQFAHFGTFEMWLTFFTILLFWFCLKLIEHKKRIYIVSLSILCGILVATKLSHIVILVIPFIALLIAHSKEKNTHQKKVIRILLFLVTLFICSIIIGLFYALTNPYVIIDNQSFLASMQYESSVGLNTLPVFYTQGFYETFPVLYQFVNIYPFLINPLLTILFIPSFIYILYVAVKTRNSIIVLAIASFLILFGSQSFLFIKWTRYMIPTLPFVYLIIAFALTHVLLKKGIHKKISYNYFATATLIIIFITSIVFSISYFISAFVQPDTRIAARTFAIQTIPENSQILSEVYDIGITPFNTAFTNITIFNTYDLETDSIEYNEQTLRAVLNETEYIILPSQRVLQTRLQNADRYPIGNSFYRALLDQKAGFTQIYQTPCDIFCQIAYLGDPTFHFEQTAAVFDRPTVYIFKKTF